MQPDHLRSRPVQAGERRVRPPGGRRRDSDVGEPAEGLVPVGRPRGAIRRRGIRHALHRLRQRHGGASSRRGSVRDVANPPSANGRTRRDRQLWRHRDSARRHARNHAAASRPRAIDGQIARAEHGRAVGNRIDGRHEIARKRGSDAAGARWPRRNTNRARPIHVGSHRRRHRRTAADRGLLDADAALPDAGGPSAGRAAPGLADRLAAPGDGGGACAGPRAGGAGAARRGGCNRLPLRSCPSTPASPRRRPTTGCSRPGRGRPGRRWQVRAP